MLSSEETEEMSIPANRLGMILFRAGKIKQAQLDFLVELQIAYLGVDSQYRLGELLVKHRVITQSWLEEALKYQMEMPAEATVSESTERVMSDGDSKFL